MLDEAWRRVPGATKGQHRLGECGVEVTLDCLTKQGRGPGALGDRLAGSEPAMQRCLNTAGARGFHP